jgi:hypothetical protein
MVRCIVSVARDHVQSGLDRVESQRLSVVVSRSDMASVTSVDTSAVQNHRRASLQQTMRLPALIAGRAALPTVIVRALCDASGGVDHHIRQPPRTRDGIMSFLGFGSALVIAMAAPLLAGR